MSREDETLPPSATGSNGSREAPEAVEADVEASRERLNSTLEAISDKLSPNQIVDQAMNAVSHQASSMMHGASHYAGSVGRMAVRHPLPLALIGIGIGWLVMSSRRDRHNDETDFDEGMDQSYAAYEGEMSENNDMESDGFMERQAHRVSQQARHYFDESPLLIGAGALAIGAILGASLPLSQTERRGLGRAASTAANKVAGLAERGVRSVTQRANQH